MIYIIVFVIIVSIIFGSVSIISIITAIIN